MGEGALGVAEGSVVLGDAVALLEVLDGVGFEFGGEGVEDLFEGLGLVGDGWGWV